MNTKYCTSLICCFPDQVSSLSFKPSDCNSGEMCMCVNMFFPPLRKSLVWGSCDIKSGRKFLLWLQCCFNLVLEVNSDKQMIPYNISKFHWMWWNLTSDCCDPWCPLLRWILRLKRRMAAETSLGKGNGWVPTGALITAWSNSGKERRKLTCHWNIPVLAQLLWN